MKVPGKYPQTVGQVAKGCGLEPETTGARKVSTDRISNARETLKEVLNILSHLENIKQNDPEILPYTHQNG